MATLLFLGMAKRSCNIEIALVNHVVEERKLGEHNYDRARGMIYDISN